MPVLVTLATINILFRGGSVVSFLDPAMLRASIESELENSNVKDAALQLVDRIEEIASQYDKSFVASIDAYVRKSRNAESTAEDLIGILEPWDNTRQSSLLEVVGVRQAMLDTLSNSEWDSIFG